MDTGILYVNPIGVGALATIAPGLGGITVALAALSTAPAVRWRYKRIQLRLARSMVERDAPEAGELLGSIQDSANAALDDLRDLARGIYPPLLADKGLAAALDAQVRKAAVPTAVETEGVGRYPRQVESAIYFCCLEALNNIAKYGSASAANIHLVQANGHLTFEVRDDGVGFDTTSTTYGTGLQGMADRLDAVGGSLSVRSAPGSGTIVTGSVPGSPLEVAP